MVTHTCILSTWKVESGRLPWLLDQLGLEDETLSYKKGYRLIGEEIISIYIKIILCTLWLRKQILDINSNIHGHCHFLCLNNVFIDAMSKR